MQSVVIVLYILRRYKHKIYTEIALKTVLASYTQS